MDDGRPLLLSTARGEVIKKSVTRYTVECEECGTAAVIADDGNPVCPDCGLICGGGGEDRSLVRDSKAAGRVDTSSTAESSGTA